LSRAAARVARQATRVAAVCLAAWLAFGASAAAACPGDCDGDGRVTIAELIRGVNIALGNAPVTNCPAFDLNGNGLVAINELVAAVNATLNGCPIEPIFPANYRETYSIVRDCRLSIEHGGVMIRVWADPTSAQAYLDEANPLPVGAVVVKEEFEGVDCDTDSELLRWRPMRKEDPGFDPEHGDWAWQWVNADRSVLFNDKTTCIGCHLEPECVARDYMCTENGTVAPTPTPAPQVGALAAVLEDLPGALLSIAGTSATDVIAVGADPGDGMGPMVLRYDGASWRRLTSGATGDLWWISVTPIDGRFFMSGAGGLVLRFDPVTESFDRDETPTTGLLYGIWGTGAGDLWAVGDRMPAGSGGALVLRNQGGGWGEVDVSDLRPPQGVPALFKVWGRAADEVYAVGSQGVILRFAGENWDLFPSGTTRNLFTVHGVGDLVSAVGGFENAAIVELDGDAFVDVTPSGFPPQMNGVFAREQGPAVAGGVGRSTAVREGGVWRVVDADSDGLRDYHAVWVDPDGGVWAVGGDLTAALDRGVVAYGGPRQVSGASE
jgi:hypothetical protein